MAQTRSRQRSAQDELIVRLNAAKQSLSAIPSGDVDGLVLFGPGKPQIVTLQGRESAYHLLVEAMNEGAATVSTDGILLYCNRRFAELLGRPALKVIGASLQSLVEKSHRDAIPAFLKGARRKPAKAEFVLRSTAGVLIPVQFSLSPLRGYRGQALGMVITDLTEQREKQEEEIRQAADLHRLLLERELLAQEGERRRIARELHDEAGQLLTSLLVAMKSLEASQDLETCRALGKRMRKVTAQALDELGRLARGLHPIALDDYGLEAALTRYVTDYSTTHRIKVRLSLDGLDSKRLPPAVQIALYRVLQETLTNVARHARARNVRVIINHSADAMAMSVIDDGRGFDASIASVGSTSHLGLRSIRERMALLGGTANFASGRKGTQVSLLIPLANWEFRAIGKHARN
ncbi:MAG TPA: sensor histidine kinase [Bryobacteraceae bacterium]|nr:sensor histidine kinase [Bryobacteraceae bacterium]